MAFSKYIPYGEKRPFDLTTTCQYEIQIWQELEMIRHLKGKNSLFAKSSSSAYIDQAKYYFLDALKSYWKSAGLLYYYSFLNLAKAYLITNRNVTIKSIQSTSIFHGLKTKPQIITKIIDYEVSILPPKYNNNYNIFSKFYETLLKSEWPFSSAIKIKISDIIPYCSEISHEVYNFFRIPKKSIEVYSLFRETENKIWFELLVNSSEINLIFKDISENIYTIKSFKDFTTVDKTDWLDAYGKDPSSIFNHMLVQISPMNINTENRKEQYRILENKILNVFKDFLLPSPAHYNDSNSSWLFVPRINIQNRYIKWHPLLSNYLISFMFSDILRYYPHIFRKDSKDSFIAEAWCNQSPSTVLRYFLLELSKQNLRVN